MIVKRGGGSLQIYIMKFIKRLDKSLSESEADESAEDKLFRMMTGKDPPPRPVPPPKKPKRVLTQLDKEEIHRRVADGESTEDVGKDFGINRSTALKIAKQMQFPTDFDRQMENKRQSVRRVLQTIGLIIGGQVESHAAMRTKAIELDASFPGAMDEIMKLKNEAVALANRLVDPDDRFQEFDDSLSD